MLGLEVSVVSFFNARIYTDMSFVKDTKFSKFGSKNNGFKSIHCLSKGTVFSFLTKYNIEQFSLLSSTVIISVVSDGRQIVFLSLSWSKTVNSKNNEF